MLDLVFTVDPEGWITVDGVMKDTTMTATYPFNFTVYGDVKIMEDLATTNIPLLLPAENMTDLPFTLIDTSLLMDVNQGLIDKNFTIILPSKQILSQFISDNEVLEMVEYFLNSTDFMLDAEYLDGDVNTVIQHTMEANLTDFIGSMLDTIMGVEMPFTMDLNYSKGEYNGSTRLVLLPGLPVEDVVMDITGNLTHTCFNGTIQVMYGDYSSIDSSIGLIDEITIDELEFYAENILNASIDVEGSLLNMSLGMVECSYINIERELVDVFGEIISFEMCIDEAIPGVFIFSPYYLLPSEVWEQEELMIELLWTYFALNNTLYEIQDSEIQLVYTPADTKLDITIEGTLHIKDLIEQLLKPIAISEEWQAWGLPPELNSTILPLNWLVLEIFNTTLSSLESSSFHLAYYSTDRRSEMNFTSFVEIEGLYNEFDFPMEYFELPPDYTAVLEPFLTNILTNIKVLQASAKYVDGEANLLVDLTFEGDINAEIDYLKSGFINLFDQEETIPWELLYFNETDIDVTGVECNIKMDDLMTEIVMKGLAIQPPIDRINASAFKLDRFFNLTIDEAFLGQGRQIGVTVIGGSNTTHKVALYNSTAVPDQDLMTLDAEGKPTLMSWNEVSLKDLRELQFILINLPPEAVILSTPAQNQISETSIVLSWSKNEDPDFVRYEIFQSTSLDALGTSIANITDRETTSYTVTDLSHDTPYYFTIRVVDNIGLHTDSSQVSATTKIPIWLQSWFIPSIIGVISIAFVSIFIIRKKRSP